MTTPNLTPEHLQTLLDGATEGEWYEDGGGVTSSVLHEMDSIVEHVYGPDANATIIALAPDLARRVIELGAENAALREVLEPPQDGGILTQRQLSAACFAAEAFVRAMQADDLDSGTVAAGKAFMAALRDPLAESLDWLRTDPDAGKAARAALKEGG